MNNIFIRRTDKITSLLSISLVLLLLSLSLFASMPISASGKAEDSAPLTYKIRLHMIRDDIAPHIRRGDNIIEAVGKYNIGVITDIRYEKCTAEVFSHRENRNILSEYEGYCDITLTVSALASKGERGYSVNGYSLRFGKEIPMRLPDFYGVGKCISVASQEGT